jgi:uncharacterized protein YcgL (UPF0745 family)
LPAPIFYLHPDDQYWPTDLATFLDHTTPIVERKAVSDTRIDLGTLNLLNETRKDGEKIYLTSRDDITSNPQWLNGVEDLRAGNAHTGAIIVVEKEQGVVDVFYFIFWAYNYGGEVLGKNLGASTVFTLLLQGEKNTANADTDAVQATTSATGNTS